MFAKSQRQDTISFTINNANNHGVIHNIINPTPGDAEVAESNPTSSNPIVINNAPNLNDSIVPSEGLTDAGQKLATVSIETPGNNNKNASNIETPGDDDCVMTEAEPEPEPKPISTELLDKAASETPAQSAVSIVSPSSESIISIPKSKNNKHKLLKPPGLKQKPFAPPGLSKKLALECNEDNSSEIIPLESMPSPKTSPIIDYKNKSGDRPQQPLRISY